MKKKIRVIGWLSEAPNQRVILGYCKNATEQISLVAEYSNVFGYKNIHFETKVVTMIPYKKAVALQNLFSGLLPTFAKGYENNFLTN